MHTNQKACSKTHEFRCTCTRTTLRMDKTLMTNSSKGRKTWASEKKIIHIEGLKRHPISTMTHIVSDNRSREVMPTSTSILSMGMLVTYDYHWRTLILWRLLGDSCIYPVIAQLKRKITPKIPNLIERH